MGFTSVDNKGIFATITGFMSFENLGLSHQLLFALRENRFSIPYPIQEKAIPPIIDGKDVMGIAKTGSGKTLSYVLPLLQRYEGNVTKNRHIAMLIVVPTRELAQQVHHTIEDYAQILVQPLKSMAVYGGASINPQMQKMNQVDILVATPGRLLELVQSNAVHLNEVKAFVLDEADKMLHTDFEKELQEILSLLPKTRQNLLFSATLHPDLAPIEGLILKDPVVIHIKEEEVDISQIKQLAYRVIQEKKGMLLRHLLQEHKDQQALVFCSSTQQAEHVHRKLTKNEIHSRPIHGKKSIGARKNALLDFKEKRIQVLVATDLLSRGIDIKGLPLVINYELPRSPKDYIHRIGRTGRAEHTGMAITMVSPDDAHHWRIIQKKTGHKIWTEDLPEWNPKN